MSVMSLMSMCNIRGISRQLLSDGVKLTLRLTSAYLHPLQPIEYRKKWLPKRGRLHGVIGRLRFYWMKSSYEK